jgi:hypothetical protein
MLEIALLVVLGTLCSRFLAWLKPWINEYDEIDC